MIVRNNWQKGTSDCEKGKGGLYIARSGVASKHTADSPPQWPANQNNPSLNPIGELGDNCSATFNGHYQRHLRAEVSAGFPGV